MKTLRIGYISVFFLISIFGCNAQTSEKSGVNTEISDNIEVYYFHFTKRCATCNAVESETKLALETFYGEKLDEGKISFETLNMDIEEEKEIAEGLGVSGQTLLVVKGGEQLNLTNEGFMNARSNPQKFHEILKAGIDKLL